MFNKRKAEDGKPEQTAPALADSGADVLSIRPKQQQEPNMARPPFPTPPTSPAANPPMPQPAVPRAPTPQVTRPGLPGAQAASAEKRTLVVGRGISVQGVVQDAERLVVEGQVESTAIRAAELAVSAGGTFKGEVEVDEAEIAGALDGTVTAKGALLVRSTGRVFGTVRCRRLQVEDGGHISGRIEMLTDGPAAAGASPVHAIAPERTPVSPAAE